MCLILHPIPQVEKEIDTDKPLDGIQMNLGKFEEL